MYYLDVMNIHCIYIQRTSCSCFPKLVSEKIDSTDSTTVEFTFTIEDEIGANTTVTVISRSYQNLHIQLLGPNNFSQSQVINGTQATMYIDGVAQVGVFDDFLSG